MLSGLSSFDSEFNLILSSFPVLKKGTFFSDTSTGSPVRVLRAFLGGLSLTENAPKPRSSTLFPLDSAFEISSKKVLLVEFGLGFDHQSWPFYLDFILNIGKTIF